MKQLFFLFSILFLFVANSFAVENPADVKNTEVSLITCGKGEELYAAFGHTAVRVRDTVDNYDIVFNYGMFNRSQPFFIPKFMRGIMDYELGVDNFNSFYIQYVARGIALWEQKLNLTPEEKLQIVSVLVENAKPENCKYRYNFVYDNCVTRPKIIFDKSFIADKDSIIYPRIKEKYTFRQLIAQYLGMNTWNKFGTDIVLGSSADKIVTFDERMFLPAEYMNTLQQATRKDGTPIVKSIEEINVTPNLTPTAPFLSPTLVFTCLFVLVAFITAFWWKKSLIWLDAFLFLVCGALGAIIFYLMFFSFHPIVGGNYNLLWINPLYLIFLFLLMFKKMRKILAYYQLLTALLLIISIAGFIFLPQQFNIAFLPIMLTLFVRSIHFVALHRK